MNASTVIDKISRRLLRNDDISEVMEDLRQAIDVLHQGPDRLDEFDAELFASLVEKITVESSHSLRFWLKGGFEVTEALREGER